MRFALTTVSLSLVLFCSSSLVSAQVDNFTGTYHGQGAGASTCNTTFTIKGREPSAPGKYPVFVYTVGTLQSIDSNGASDAAVAGMASRGFVAATVEYDTATFAGCSIISGKAGCIYDPNRAASAITAICARDKADCSKGIVVGGLSQGSVLATLAHNFNNNVQAAWGIGDGVQYLGFDLRACMKSVNNGGTRTLPNDRLRVVNGIEDVFVSLGQDDGRSQAQELTGFGCGTSANSCLQANGSGWFIVQNSEIPPDLDSFDPGGVAEHCYMHSQRSILTQCALLPTLLNDTWQFGAAPWSLSSNLDWLRSFVVP